MVMVDGLVVVVAVKSRQISMNRAAEVSVVQWSFGVFLVDMVASW